MTWDQITQTDKYRSLSPEVRQGVKERYFTRVIAPALSDKVSSQEELNDFYARFMERPDDTGEGALRSATSAFARGALRPLSDIPIAVGALTGAEGIEELGKGIQSGVEGAFPVNPAQEGFFTTELPGVAGQVTSILGGGLGGASLGTRLAGKAATELAAKQAAKLGAKAAVGTQAFTGGAAGGAAAADQYGLTDGQKAARALLGGVTELGVEALPFGMLTETGPIRKLMGESIEGGFMKPVITGAGTEAVEEGLAETIGQATDVAFAPKQAQMDLKQIGKAMLLGGAGGAMFGGVQAVIAPQTTQAVNETGEFNRIRSTEELPQDVVEAVKRGDGSRLVYDRRGQVIGYKPATVAPGATPETVEAEMPIEINVPAEDETGPEWISGAGLLRAAERRAVQLENKAEDVDTSETDMEGNVIRIGVIKRGFLTPGEQNELNQLRKLLSGDEPDLAGLAALYGMKIKTQKTEGQTKQAPSATATPSQQPEQTRPSSEPATNPLSLVGKDARVMDNEGNIWQRVPGSPKWERVDASGRPLDKIGQEVDSPPVDVTREGITDPRYNRDLQTEAQDKNPEDAARPISLIKQILTELEMLADAQQDKGATRAERRQLLSDLLFWQNRLRQIAGKPQITEAPITQQEQEKSRAFLQARAAQIQAKLENNQPITSTERQEWLAAGMDEALLPPKEDDLKLSALPAEVAPEVEQMVQNVATNPTTPLTAAALKEDLQGGLTEAPQPDMEANLLTGVPMRQPLGGEIRAEETVLEGQPIEDEQAPQQLAKTDELTPTWETSPEFAAAEEAAAAGDLERADAIEAEWRVRNDKPELLDKSAEFTVQPEEISANLVDEEADVAQGGDVRIQATKESPAGEVPTKLATEGAAPTPGGVGATVSLQRDPSKPEQMTPGEFNATRKALADKIATAEAKLADAEAIQPSKNPAIQIKQIAKIRARKQELDDAVRLFEDFHPTMVSAVDDAVKKRAPFSVAAHQESGMVYVPQGYVLNEAGDLYVYQPDATPATAERGAAPQEAIATPDATPTPPPQPQPDTIPAAQEAEPQAAALPAQPAEAEVGEATRELIAREYEAAESLVSSKLREIVNGGILRGAEIKLKSGRGKLLITKPSPGDAQDTVFRVTHVSDGGDPTGHMEVSEEQWSRLQRDIGYMPLGMLGELRDAVFRQIRPDIVAAADLGLGGKRVIFQYSLRNRDAVAGAYPENGFLPEETAAIRSRRGILFDRPLTQRELDSFEIEPIGAFEVKEKTVAKSVEYPANIETAFLVLSNLPDPVNKKKPFPKKNLDAINDAIDAAFPVLMDRLGPEAFGFQVIHKPSIDGAFLQQAGDTVTPWRINAAWVSPEQAVIAAQEIRRRSQPAEAEAAADAGVTTPETTAPTREQAASQRLRDYIASISNEKSRSFWTPERLAVADAYYASGDESLLDQFTKTQRNIVKREGTSDAEAKTADAERMRQFKQRNPQAASDIENLTESLNQLRDETTRISQAEPGDVSTGDTSETLDTEDVSSERAKAVQRYVAGLDWANMGAEQRRKAMLDFAKKVSAKLANSPIWNGGLSSIVSLGEGRAYTEFAVKGGSLSQQINIGLDTSIGEQMPSAEAALSQVYRVVEEEFMHAVHVQAAFNRWKQLKQDGDFKDWLIQDSAKNILEILGKRNALRSSGDNEAADRIQDSLATIALMYWQGDEAIDVLDFLDDPSIATTFYLEAARMLAQVQIDGFSSETEFARFFHAIRQALNKALNLLRSAAELVKTGALGEALKRDVGTLQYAIRKMREYASMIDAAESGPPPASESEFLKDYNAYINSFGDGQLGQLRESRKAAPEPEQKAMLRAKDGSVLRTGVETLEAEAARTSYEGIIPGVEQSWIGTSEEFRQQFPNGYNLGGGKKFPEPTHEALVAPDGRVFIFTDHAEILEGDVERALRYGTTPGVEATKRLLRHESFAHRGFMSLPAPLKRRFMDLIEAGVIPEAELDYLVRDRGYDNLANWRDNISERQLIAEEWLAHKLERMKDIPQSGPLAEFLDWLKDVWRYLTGGETDSNAVLRDTMRAMHKALGALEPGQRIIDEQVRASYIGESAIENMPEERKQFMRDSLDTAKAMAAAGKSSEEIRAVTGWFPGKYDGKMRWEVPDEGAKMTGRLPAMNKSLPLGSVIKHDELFKAYPHFTEIPVFANALGGSEVAHWDAQGYNIVLDPRSEIFMFGGGIKTLLHEIQHAIQSEEKFAKGGSPDLFEVDADLKKNKAILKVAQKALLLLKLSKSRGGSIDAVVEMLKDPPYREKIARSAIELAKREKEGGILEIIQELERRIADGSTAEPYAKYLRIAGEIEARDVSERRKFTPEQRKAVAPYSSENIPTSDAIIITGDVKKQMDSVLSAIPFEEQSASTQVATTTGSYRTAAKILEKEGIPPGSVLDYGAGLGLGSDALRETFESVDSLEVNPQRWKGLVPPRFTSSEQIDGKYSGIVNLNVLNVVPRNIRDAIVLHIGEVLEVGGVAVIGVRKWTDDVNRAKNAIPGEEPKSLIIDKKQGATFQKGFDGNELVEYLQELLGDGFEVRKASVAANGAVVRKLAIAPYSSENIAPEDAIVMFGGSGSQASMARQSVAQNQNDRGYSQAAIVAIQNATSGLASDIQFLSDIFESKAFQSKGFDGLSEVLKRQVILKVLSLRNKNPEVFNAIIAPVSVDVVNNFTSSKATANTGLDNYAMLQFINSVDLDKPVSVPVEVSNSIGLLIGKVALLRAEVISSSSDLGGGFSAFGAAVRTVDGNTANLLLDPETSISSDSVATRTAESTLPSRLLARGDEKLSTTDFADFFKAHGSILAPVEIRDKIYFATVERGDSGGDNLIQLLRDAPESERKAVVDAWVQRNPAAAERAQMAVNEVAKAAGGMEVWHGGDIEGSIIDVNRRERGAPSEQREGTFYASTNKNVAESYPGKVNRLFFFLRNPFQISTPQNRPASWTGETAVQTASGQAPKKTSLSIGESVDRAKRFGYDGVVYGNIVDLGRFGKLQRVVKGPTQLIGDTVVAFYPNQIKSADPVTYDDSGNIIPPSQRFQSTSPDIRYSRRTIQAQVPELTSPDTAARSQENPMAFERDYGFLPAEYYKMAEAGRVADALQGYAVEKVAPYAKSQKKLLELREILMDDRRILDEFGIGATTGQAGLGYIYAEAALQAEKLGDRTLSESFAFGRTAVGTSKGQGLVSEKFLVNDPRYQTLFHIQQANAVAREEQRNVVGGKFGEATPKLLEGELDKATEASGENVAGAIPAEISISEKVLELGAAVQNNPKLSERIKQFLTKIVTLGRLRQARENAKVPRASIISNAESFEGMTPEELDAEIARLEAEIESEFTALEKDVAAAAKKPTTKKPQTPIETAKAIINRVQKKAATETAKPKPKLDRVRILYKSHLRERMDEQRFMKEAAAAGLDAKTAKELYDAAELEIAAIMLSKEVRGNSDNYDKLTKERIKHLDVDTSALVEYVNRLRRDGKLGEVRWADIFQLPPTRQQVIKDSLLDIVSSNPELQNLSEEEKSILADALERVWERERDRQFKMQVKRMELAGVKKEDADKLAEATPRLIRLINQGMTTTDAFYKAVGEQYGIKELSEAERKRVAELAEKVQDPELGRADKAKYARELVSILQKNHKLTRSEIISNVWVAHVLSGVRTQFDMALGVMNGLFSTVKKAAYTIYVNPNAKGAKAAGKGLQQFFAGLVDGIAEAARYVRTEEPGLIDSDIEFVSSYFEGGIGKGGISTARKLRESEKKIVRALGTWLSILERVTTAWDVINYRATLQGTLAMASQMNPRLYKEALMPTDADFAAMSERAKQMLGPTATRAQITARAMSYITDGIHLLGKNLDDAAMQQWKQMTEDFRYDAKEATYMVDPTGIGGFFYNGIMGLAAKGEKLAKQRAEDAKKRAAGEEVSTTGNVAQRIFPPMLYFLATQARNLLGFRFIRFTGNKVNELISFMPFIGMARIYLEQGMRRDGELTLKGANVRMNQFISIAFGIPIFIKALLDLDKEDEERGYIVEGSWDNLTPARKAQRMSTGAKPNTISFYDEDTGRWTSWNYINWPFAGILATIGSVSDYRRYTPEKWNEKTAAEKIMAGVYAGGSSFLDISSISQMTELFGRSTYSTDPSTKGIEKLTKAFTNYAGGFVPRLFKDIDSWFDDSGYRPEDTWGHLAAQIPVLRRSAGAPIRDIFYERVSVSRTPWSRVVQVSPDDEVYKTLGLLNSRGIWLTPPNPENRKIRTRDGLREMTEDEGARYMELTGQGYRNMIQKYGKKLLGMQPERAEVWVQKYAERVREMALKKALAKRGQSVTIDVE